MTNNSKQPVKIHTVWTQNLPFGSIDISQCEIVDYLYVRVDNIQTSEGLKNYFLSMPFKQGLHKTKRLAFRAMKDRIRSDIASLIAKYKKAPSS